MTNPLDSLNLRPFEKRLVVGVGILLFIVLNAWFVIPHFKDWRRTKSQIAEARVKLEKFNTSIGQMPDLEKKIKAMEGQAQTLPLEDQATEFLRVIQVQQARAGVAVANTTPHKPQTNQFFLEQSATLRVTAPESQLVDFLYGLGSGDSLIRVRDLTLRPDQPRQQLDATVQLVASYQKAPPKTAAPSPARAEKSRTGATDSKSGTPGARPEGSAPRSVPSPRKTTDSTAK
jgi:Tfp pilus assembly protein PilO